MGLSGSRASGPPRVNRRRSTLSRRKRTGFSPKAYDLLLNQLLHSLESRITPAEKGELLRDVGRRLAGVRAPLSGVPTETELRERLKIAVGVLKDLGGLVELEDTGDEKSSS